MGPTCSIASQTFLADVSALPFDLRYVPEMLDIEAMPRDPVPSFDYQHNWFVLTRVGSK